VAVTLMIQSFAVAAGEGSAAGTWATEAGVSA
jgi:hypothetical protein